VKFQTRSIVCIILCAMSLCASAEMRVWHDKDGKEYTGNFEREAFGKLFFRGPDKKIFSLVATNLIDSDLEHVRSNALPEVQIQFQKSKRLKDKPDKDWGDDMEMEVKGTVKIRKTSKFPYFGTLKGEVYLIAEEVATDDYKLVAKKTFPVKFPNVKKAEVEAKISVIIRNFKDKNEDMRGAFYEGYVVIVSDADGTPMELKTDLGWITEEKIDALRRLPVPGFLNKECKKRPVPRPHDYRSDGFNFQQY